MSEQVSLTEKLKEKHQSGFMAADLHLDVEIEKILLVSLRMEKTSSICQTFSNFLSEI